MFRAAQSGATAYAILGMETAVISATSHDLILMLFDGASAAVSAALNHMSKGQTEEKGRAVSKAVLIIESGLRASLNKEVGGELAQSLDSLYEYMSTRLVMGNMQDKAELLEEVLRLLGELKEPWASIGKTPADLRSLPSNDAGRLSHMLPLTKA
jgi:flagellar secretion chaperone FliS